MENLKTLKVAKKNGYYCLALLLGTLFIQGYVSVAFPEETLMLAIFTAVGTLVIAYTYIVMLRGITLIANESGDQTFIISTKNFIGATIILCLFGASIGLVEELNDEIFSKIFSLISIVSLVYLGIVSLKISKGFKAVEDQFGKTAKRTIFWHKITGYLLVTVILSFIGIITSLVADFFMWRLINMRLQESDNSTQANGSN